MGMTCKNEEEVKFSIYALPFGAPEAMVCGEGVCFSSLDQDLF